MGTPATFTRLAVGFGPRVTLVRKTHIHPEVWFPRSPISRSGIQRPLFRATDIVYNTFSRLSSKITVRLQNCSCGTIQLLMAVLVDKNTKVLVCGMTGKEGTFHTQQMLAYGTNVVAGLTPGKGGTEHLGVPVFDTAKEAVEKTGADAALIFVPAAFAADSVLECEAAGIPFVTLITEGVPVLDMLRVVNRLKANGTTRLLGGNCAGIITPGECKMGIMPGNIFLPGPVGMVSRSGTLTYEIAWELTRANLGQTTCVGIGGDPIPGTRFKEVVEMFENDPATQAVVLVGEIGGSDEEEGAAFIKAHMSKPVVAFISGRTAPPGKRMGHAGAIIAGKTGTPQSKVDALEDAGVAVADKTSDVARLVQQALDSRKVQA